MSKYIELSVPGENLPDVSTIIGTMSFVQQIKGTQKTFGNITKLTFNTMMAETTSAKQTDMVFDIYSNG